MCCPNISEHDPDHHSVMCKDTMCAADLDENVRIGRLFLHIMYGGRDSSVLLYHEQFLLTWAL